MIKLAINSFLILGVRDFGRIDIRANKAGDCFFIEANLVPGMTYGSSYFPKSCEIERSLPYDKVIQIMLASGLCRAEQKQKKGDKSNIPTNLLTPPMARPLRLEFSGALYHVTSRGDRRKDIYLDDDDRTDWLAVLDKVCSRFNWKVILVQKDAYLLEFIRYVVANNLTTFSLLKTQSLLSPPTQKVP